MRPGTALRAAGLIAALAGLALAFGAPRFTWSNAGLEVRHPPIRGLAPLVGAAALGLGVLGPQPRALRFAGIALGAGLTALGAQRLLYRLDAVQTGLAQRDLAGATRLAWVDIDRVESRPFELVVTGKDGTRLSVTTARFLPEDRARLERTIARRVRETGSLESPSPGPGPPRPAPR